MILAPNVIADDNPSLVCRLHKGPSQGIIHISKTRRDETSMTENYKINSRFALC